MANYRALPGFLGNVSQRFSSPIAASVVVGVLLIALTWAYLLATSVQEAFSDVISVTGLLFATFYILTSLATVFYYRRRVFGSVWDFLLLGMLSLGSSGFLGWIIARSVQAAPAAQLWSLVGIIALGLILMLFARFVLRSSFFQIPRESDREPHGRLSSSWTFVKLIRDGQRQRISGWQHPCAACAGVAQQCLRVGRPASNLVGACQLHAARQRVRVIGAQNPAVVAAGILVELQRGGRPARRQVGRAQGAASLDRVQVVGPEEAFPAAEYALVV
jgi:signal transduction histidine kinase